MTEVVQRPWSKTAFVMAAVSATINVVAAASCIVGAQFSSSWPKGGEWLIASIPILVAVASCLAVAGIRLHWNDALCTTLVLLSEIWTLLLLFGAVIVSLGGAV